MIKNGVNGYLIKKDGLTEIASVIRSLLERRIWVVMAKAGKTRGE
jgi:hypothetical protein